MTSRASFHTANGRSPIVGWSLSRLFEGRAEICPDATALTLGESSLTYGDLNARANRIAARLRQLGVGPDSIVAIHLDRSFELIAGILAILKTGGAYLPLDLASPDDRLAFMLEDSDASVLITDSTLVDRFGEYEGAVVCLDRDAGILAKCSTENVASLTPRPNHLAYVIYVSGASGMPQGCLITHENVLRLFTSTDPLYHFGEDDVWTLFHSTAFDISVWEIFGALLYGGRLVLVPHMIGRSASEFRELLIRERVTVLTQTPSAFRQLIHADEVRPAGEYSLRHVIFGGEALDPVILQPWFERYGDEKPQVANMYGTTESTVHATYRRVRGGEHSGASASNIGTPVPEVQIYIVDRNLRRLAVGEVGEILIGGLGVGLGYLDRDELTSERFIANPFDPEKGLRLYRTGDLGSLRTDGSIEFAGRVDRQVKIRGFRVEPGEIESMLACHEAIRENAVLARADAQGGLRLVAYVALNRRSLGVERIRTFLAQKLPDFMLPTAFVFIDHLPRTSDGEIDYDALPAPTAGRPPLAAAFVAPRGELESVLAELWKTALRQEQVSVDDNFFDLGADSLLVTRVHHRLEEILGRQIPITDLFGFPTIRRLAGKLSCPPHHS